ncbi:hypothetical protein HMI54_015246 [Coelomomyces lativittatus]|nr:hypothetical protein HMI55_002171 [Coelomomyces lativittatus]KAJ1504553.1 hypothetical protein HMI56_001577 [Coelomomyces lativittatus]KAJ1513081.1 hypothetical protein HMI54_015246 [Coelomomyces lativittatus]
MFRTLFIRSFSSHPSVPTPTFNLRKHWLELSHLHPKHPNVISKFHYVWLRDHCLCEACKHELSGQKLHQSGHLPLSLVPSRVDYLDSPSRLHIHWPAHSIGGSRWISKHESMFPFPFLRAWDYSQPNLPSWLYTFPSVQPWSACTPMPHFTYPSLSHAQVLTQLAQYGYVKVKHVPVGQLETFAETYVGQLRDTFYGRVWQVFNDPLTTNIASTSFTLPLHMDLMYFENPPYLQLIQYDQTSPSGGESTFLDMFDFWQTFQQLHPDSATFLASTSHTFHYVSKNQRRAFLHPFYTGTSFSYAPPFQGPTWLPFDQMLDWYTHMQVFETELDQAKVLIEKMEVGDVVIFQNRRILHGRLGFQGHERKISGCYIDFDEFASMFRKIVHADGFD